MRGALLSYCHHIPAIKVMKEVIKLAFSGSNKESICISLSSHKNQTIKSARLHINSKQEIQRNVTSTKVT